LVEDRALTEIPLYVAELILRIEAFSMRNLFSLAFLLRRELRIHFFLGMNSAQFQSRNKRKVRKLENELDWGKFERSSGIDYREEQRVFPGSTLSSLVL